MARTTPAAVKVITGSDADESAIWPFVEVAHLLVEQQKECAGVSEDALENAEKFLAAHLTTISQGAGGAENAAVSSEQIESLRIQYQVSQIQGQGVLSTSYGQTANALMNGCLQESDKRKSAILFTGGA